MTFDPVSGLSPHGQFFQGTHYSCPDCDYKLAYVRKEDAYYCVSCDQFFRVCPGDAQAVLMQSLVSSVVDS